MIFIDWLNVDSIFTRGKKMKLVLFILSTLGLANSATSNIENNNHKSSLLQDVKINLISAADTRKTEGSGSLIPSEEINTEKNNLLV